MDLRELYQDIILDHGRHPRNFRRLAEPSHLAHGHNPLCGDKVTIFLKIDGDRIEDISFEGRGCAISTASASLMTEVLTGKSLHDVESLFRFFHAKVTTGAAVAIPVELDEDGERLEPFGGVKAYPARVKCATLAWHALDAAMRGGSLAGGVKTE